MRVVRRQSRLRRGATLVESAIVLSALLLLLFGILEYGRYIMLRHVVDNAARDGARLAVAANLYDSISYNYQTDTDVKNRVVAVLAGQDKVLTGVNIQVYAADAQGNNRGQLSGTQAGQFVAVQIDASYRPMLPGLRLPFVNVWIGLFPQTVTLSAKAVMQTEGN